MSSEIPPASENRAQPFRVAGRLVDPVACRLQQRAGEEIHVEPKAMQVLAYLAERSGQVVSRRELEDSVWADSVVGHKAVTNTIIKLRKALGDDSRDPQIIETIPKRGYRLIAEVVPESPGPGEKTGLVHVEAHLEPHNDDLQRPVPTTLRERQAPVVRWLATAAVVVLICGGGLLAWYQPWAPEFEPVSPEAMALPLPDKPSIVVLPFHNLSGDAEHEYLADATTDTMISVLSQIPEIFVISRSSAFTYKDRPVPVPRVAEELGIRYVLEGSVQRSGDRVRVTAQLVDATKGHSLWSERYDRTFLDLFELQDEIALKTAVSLQVRLTMGEQARVLSQTTDSVEAWIYYAQALSEFLKFSGESNSRARQLAGNSLALDPDFADAMIILGFTHLIDARHEYSASREGSLRRAVELSRRAGELAPGIPMLYNLEQAILRLEGKLDEAVIAGEQAIKLSPSTSISLLATAMTMHYAGHFDRSIELAEQAMRHDPHYSSANLIWVGWSSWFKQDYERAISSAEEGLRRAEDPALEGIHHLTLALTYADKGELEQARSAVANARKAYPPVSVGYFRRGFPYKNPAHQERLLHTLRKAGLPKERGQ